MNRSLPLLLVALIILGASLSLPRPHAPTPVGDLPPAAAGPTPIPVAVALPPGASTPPAAGTDSGDAVQFLGRATRGAVLAAGDDLDVVYEITGGTAQRGERVPLDLAVVLDRSGSMTGAPIEKAKEAARALVERLTLEDRLAVVVFDSHSTRVLDLTVMNGAGRERAMSAIDGIATGSTTNISDGIQNGVEALSALEYRPEAVRKLILLTDGEANEGWMGPSLVSMVRSLEGENIRVSALGLGVEFDENLLVAMASAGRGQYRYLRDADTIQSALAAEVDHAGTSVATSVTASFVPGPGVSIVEAYGYESARDGAAVAVRLPNLAAGEHRKIVLHVRTGRTAARERMLVTGTLAFDDVGRDRRHRTLTSASAVHTTKSAEEVRRSANPEASRLALRAHFGLAIADVSAAYRGNDLAAARAGIERQWETLRSQALALGDAVLAREIQDRTRTYVASVYSMTPSSSGGRDAIKSMGSDDLTYMQ